MNLTSNAHTGRRDSRKLKSYYFNPTLKTQKNELSEEKLMLTPVSSVYQRLLYHCDLTMR